jgi:N5-(cytidine 5'-diphosphoramidyl)-L-glutamine hydrolase
MKKLNIGISMRETNAVGYIEKRDSLARDWYRFMKINMPNANWILLPNIGNDINGYIQNWNINGFILSGGENLSVSRERDITEKKIFEYSQTNSLPILGVCRGFQAIFKWLGGDIKEGDETFSARHVATRHKIYINDEVKEVNSYHSNKLLERGKPESLQVLARCDKDNSIEAYQAEKLLGVMWHPEREGIINNWDTELIKKLFRYE